MNQPILFKKLNSNAQIPVRASEHAAGFDLFACSAHVEGGHIIIGTGIATAFAEDHVLLIYGRSGYAFKYGIHLSNGVGVIDADYRGEIKLSFETSRMPLVEAAHLLSIGNRVAQAILMPIPSVDWIETDELPETIRGENGFGSTGTGVQ